MNTDDELDPALIRWVAQRLGLAPDSVEVHLIACALHEAAADHLRAALEGWAVVSTTWERHKPETTGYERTKKVRHLPVALERRRRIG